MKSKIIGGLLLGGIMAILFGCAKKETIDLKLKLEVGQVDRVYVATVIKGSLVNSQSIIEMRFTTEAVKPDRNVIGVKVARLSMTSGAFGENGSYDSNKDINEMTDEEKNMHQELQQILNQSFQVSVNNKGKVIESFRNKNGERRRPTDQIINISNIYIPFPEEPVGMGSEWEAEREEPLAKIKTTSTYKITEINDKEIIVSITSRLKNEKGYFDNVATGQYVLDRKTCKMISGDLSLDVKDNGEKGKVFFKIRSIPD
ncbi:hypothetical protein [Flavobacterium microcysteis]|uniref:Lipoprotein n=1 Tax=Flavobacterium microcysteis TaxID=2596891 RepID=A0A501QI34_9FLAO|nr:hypothetical protein [Flavobacterium microcysteis]TPD71825.1 hypothetical protein FJA49_02810 [Flavobacterium microcysteis]